MTTIDRDDWLAERTKSMGASDIAAASTGRYGGSAKAIASKLGLPVADIDPALADRGHRWEQPVADGVLAHYGLYVLGEQLLLRRPDEPHIHVTVDGLLSHQPDATMAETAGVLEIKTRHPRAPWPRDYWAAQCQVAMWVTETPRALLAIATIDEDWSAATGLIEERLVSVHYEWLDADPFEQERLVELGRWLWDHVERRELPEPTDAAALPYIKAAHITPDPAATADIDDLADLIRRREALLTAIGQSTEEAKTIEAKIRHRVGDATEATTSDGRWRIRIGQPVRRFTNQSEADFLELYLARAIELGVTRTTIDRAKAKELMSDEYDALRIATPDRRLTVKDNTPEETTP